MTPDLAELKRIAEAANVVATGQFSGLSVDYSADGPGGRPRYCVGFHSVGYVPVAWFYSRHDADLCAALFKAHVALIARIEALEGALEVFARYGLLAGTDLDDETVIRLTYDDPEWGDDTVIGEVFLRPFRRAANLLGDRHD